MSVKVRELMQLLEEAAPAATAAAWDNVGLMTGRPEQEIHRVLLALDLSAALIDEAEAVGADMILLHHPPLFRPAKDFRSDRYPQNLLVRLAVDGIACFAAHTNLDAALGGVNDCLARSLGLAEIRPLPAEGELDMLGRIGLLLQPVSGRQLAEQVKIALSLEALRAAGDLEKSVSKVAVCGGAGADLLAAAKAAGADCLVTADCKYHSGLEAEAIGILLLDGGHYQTERGVLPVLAESLRRRFAGAELEVLTCTTNTDPWRFL